MKNKKLKFSTNLPERMGGGETHFVEKILKGQKIHTIRKGQKYKAGDVVDLISIDENGKEICFFEGLEIVSVQEVEIFQYGLIHPHFSINEVPLLDSETDELAYNDGFVSLNDFEKYFNEDFKGQILHFTNFKY